MNDNTRIIRALNRLKRLEETYEYLWQDTDDKLREQIYHRALIHFRDVISILEGKTKIETPEKT